MRSFRPFGAAAALGVASLLTACADAGVTGVQQPRTAFATSTTAQCTTLDFDAVGHGAQLNAVTAAGATWSVTASAIRGLEFGGGIVAGKAVGFNTNETAPVEDLDLLWKPTGAICAACEGLNSILVVEDVSGFAQYGDNAFGGTMTFTRTAGTGSYYIESFYAVDQDGQETLRLHVDKGAAPIATALAAGNGSVQKVVPPKTLFSTSFDFRMGDQTDPTGQFTGSGGVDSVRVCAQADVPPPPPPPTNPGTGTPGYWKNHKAAWPVTTIVIGGVSYTRELAIATMQRATKTDKTYNLFEQLVAAKLNGLAGNNGSCITADIAAADAFLAMHAVGSGVKADSTIWQSISAAFTRLDRYNNGLLCAPSRG